MYPLIDILKLHHPEDTEKSAVRAFGGEKLNKIFDELSTSFCQNSRISYAQLAKIMNVNKISIQNWRGFNKKYPKGHPIPLWALDKLLQLTYSKGSEMHNEIIRNITHLQCGRVSKKIKAVIYLRPELANICGAHAADGCLYGWKGKGPTTARWDIGDLEKSNILAVKKWIDDLFEIELPILKKGKMSYIWTNMQIISRYLVLLFDFPIGEKSHIVKEPAIFSGKDARILSEFPEDLRWQLRWEFAKEVINFDGHSTIIGGIVSIGLGSESELLRNNLVEIFAHLGINFHNYQYEKNSKILTTAKKEAV